MKIKKNIALLLTVSAILSFSFVADGTKKLIPGVGVTGELAIGQTTREDLVKNLGGDYVEKKFYSKGEGDSVLYSSSLYYEKHGVTAWFKAGETKAFTFYFFKNSNAATKKGITVGVSTMQDVENAYGKAELYTNSNSMFFEYEGIAFHAPFDGKFPIKKSTKKKMMKMPVQYISIKAIE
jgi:hypothetical protein